MKRHTPISFHIFQGAGLEKKKWNVQFFTSSVDSTAWTAYKFRVYIQHGVHVANRVYRFLVLTIACTPLQSPDIFRSSRSQMLFKIGVIENFAIFPGKHLRWSLFLIKLQALRTLRYVFPCEYYKIFRNDFFIEHLLWLLPYVRTVVRCLTTTIY